MGCRKLGHGVWGGTQEAAAILSILCQTEDIFTLAYLKFGSRFLPHAHLKTSPQEPKMVPVPVPSPVTKRVLVVGFRQRHRKKRGTSIDTQATPTGLELKDINHCFE